MNLPVGRRIDNWLFLLSGTADYLALDGHAPTVVSNLDVNVLLTDTGQLSFDYIRVTLFGNVDGRAQSTPSQSKERVVENRVASSTVSNGWTSEEWILEHSEERAELAEEVAAERHFAVVVLGRVEGGRPMSPEYIYALRPTLVKARTSENMRELRSHRSRTADPYQQVRET